MDRHRSGNGFVYSFTRALCDRQEYCMKVGFVDAVYGMPIHRVECILILT